MLFFIKKVVYLRNNYINIGQIRQKTKTPLFLQQKQ